MANLVSAENSSFEGGTIGDWAVTAGDITLSNSTAIGAISGTHTLRAIINEPDVTDFTIQTTSSIAVSPSSTYNLSCWYYVPPGAPSLGSYQFGVELFDESASSLGPASVVAAAEVPGGWQFLEVTDLPLEQFVGGSWIPAHSIELFFTTHGPSFGADPFGDGELRYWDVFLVEAVPGAPPSPTAASPPSLRQRQNPLRIRGIQSGGGT